MFLCPGDGAAISHAIHLGRLASHYPPCAGCEHRPANFGPILGRPVIAADALFTEDGFAGIIDEQVSASVARRLALAIGCELRNESPAESHLEASPTQVSRTIGASQRILVGADGRASVAELLAATCEGLRAAGCHVVELEPMTAPQMVATILELDSLGGVYLGNPAGDSHAVAIRCWSRDARPLCGGGRLDAVRRRFQGELTRPVRASGQLERHRSPAGRLDRGSELFHALRPLRFALDTASAPLSKRLTRLLEPTACERIVPEWIGAPGAASRTRSPTGDEASHGRRIDSLAAFTIERQADFGAWIDGDGERLAVVDERGVAVDIERLLSAIAELDPVLRPGFFSDTTRLAAAITWRRRYRPAERGWVANPMAESGSPTPNRLPRPTRFAPWASCSACSATATPRCRDYLPESLDASLDRGRLRAGSRTRRWERESPRRAQTVIRWRGRMECPCYLGNEGKSGKRLYTAAGPRVGGRLVLS